MSHSSHSTSNNAGAPAQGNTGAQQTSDSNAQQEYPAASPTNAAAAATDQAPPPLGGAAVNIISSAAPASSAVAPNVVVNQHVHQISVQQPAAPGETDNIQPEVEDEDDSNLLNNATSSHHDAGLPEDNDLERGIQQNAAGAQVSDSTMNEEGVVAQGAAAAVPGSAASGAQTTTQGVIDADMELGAAAGSSLPPIDDVRRQQQDSKALQKAQREAQECAQFKTMTLDQKKKVLDAYNPSDYYTKGCFLDAQDTTNCFIMAKVVQATGTDVTVNYDGWSEKWNYQFRKKSYKIEPFRSKHYGYSGQKFIAIRNTLEEITFAEIRVHISTLEGYIASDFEGRSAHQISQYVRGHLFVFMDSLMGMTYRSTEVDEEHQTHVQDPGKIQFFASDLQKLWKTYLRFITAYLRKLKTLGKSIQELAQVPKLFLVDPDCAIVCLVYELTDSLRRLFCTKGRNIKHMIRRDYNQLPTEQIAESVRRANEQILPNSFGNVVQDYLSFDFEARCPPENQEYQIDQAFQMVKEQNNLVFGNLLNYVQYFAEVGGFDALLAVLQMGMQTEQTQQQDQESATTSNKLIKIDSTKSSSAGVDPASVKLPFKLMSVLTKIWTHLGKVLTEQFSKQFTETVKQVMLTRLDTMTEKDLKDVDKDEISRLINSQMRKFLSISLTRQETAEFVEHTQLVVALRFLKSENLEKRLKGLSEIRGMIERVNERMRFEKYRAKTGKTLNHWKALQDNKERAWPSDILRASDLKKWLIENKVLVTILGPNAHIEIVKRSGPLLKFLCRHGDNLFDESIVELIWKCQLGKHEEMVRTIYNLIQEVLPGLTLQTMDSFFQKIQDMPPTHIDEKYINFMREFTKMALKARFEHSYNEFMHTAESKETNVASDQFFKTIRDTEKQTISGLTGTNAHELIPALESQTHDYGLRMFWQISQDQPETATGIGQTNNAPLSAELQELVISSLMDIFAEGENVKQVRSLYLLKAVQNILAFRSLHQSCTILMQIISSIQKDEKESELNKFEEESDQTEPVSISSDLERQASLIEALVTNIQRYHEQVKQKCKQLYKAGTALPDKIDEQVFAGRYSHEQTLQALLDMIEFMITQTQKDLNQMTVSIGEENIRRLWVLLVKEPNFQSDQTLFLNWINKQRTNTVIFYKQYQKMQQTFELFLFTEQEKTFIFQHFLCNPEEVDVASISVAQVQVFQKYFRMINMAQKYMFGHKNKFKVVNFDKLIGMDALWKMALLSQNEKAKEISQALLVALHLKFDNQTATTELKEEVIGEFVKKCMIKLGSSEGMAVSDTSQIDTGASQPAASDADKKAVTQLLSLFLDRYEGLKELKPELTSMARLTNIKPFDIDCYSYMDPENRTMTKLSVSYFQTLGHLREKIAKELRLEINEFILQMKNAPVDPDIDDEKYFKDYNGLPTKCIIKRNPNYDPLLHPKFLLAKNQENFNVIFAMLQASSPDLCEPVWALISKLPVNQSVIESLKSLEFIKVVTQQPEAAAAAVLTDQQSSIMAAGDCTTAWNSLLDPEAIFKMLYSLQIMQQEFMNAQLPQRDDEIYDEEMNAEFNLIIQAYDQQRIWKEEFIQLGGFSHLLTCLVQLNLHEIHTTLELRVIKSLIQIIFKFINHSREMQQLHEAENQNNTDGPQSGGLSLLENQSVDMRNGALSKVMSLIDAICKYNLEKEKLRGESIETIQKKIESAKLIRKRQREMALGNKAEKRKGSEDDDDGDSDDKNLLLSLMSGFREEADIIQHLFDFVDSVMTSHPESPTVIMNYPDLVPMLERGMITCENQFLRENMCKRIKDILQIFYSQSSSEIEQASPVAAVTQQQSAPNASDQCFAAIMKTVLSKVIMTSKDAKYEGRSHNFYNQICLIVSVLQPKDLEVLQSEILFLMEQLPRDIIERPTREIGINDYDGLLFGLMNIMMILLQRFPMFKKQEVSRQLTKYLIHECLFEIPHGSKNAPKCKSSQNRHQAFALLRTLATDCIENLLVILNYMKQFNQNPSWRTNKESDWNIKLYEDEKSSTGRVGIKNLGCICYMNSLNQQLFMIPGFRNDILSVKDPNHDNNQDEDNMFLQWQTLFAGLLLSQKMYVNPKNYCHAFKDWEGQPVNVFEQMDVEEYLTMFMDRLEAAIKGTAQEKTIQYHFGGKFANEVICKTCPHKYCRDETFLSLGVPVKNKKSLQEGMEAFVAGDLLDQDNQYHCEKCDKKVDALKRTCLKEMPRYLIATLKRFDFDFDLMIRKKLNDYFEFQTEIDLSEYTQDYLNQKESYEKEREEKKKNQTGDEADDEAMQEIKLRQPSEYYKFDLVGIIVHTGTADSGHYYSYIKEQDELRLEKDGTDKWYEFNDILVRDFDAAEIPTETYGGEETSYQNGNNFGNGQGQKMLRMRNAYVLVFKRKLTDESLIVADDAASSTGQQSATAAEGANANDSKSVVEQFELGSQTLQLDADNPLNKRIQWDNHRYWHIRYMFREDYQSFVTKVLLYWHTNFIIPERVTWRNSDFHLIDQSWASYLQYAKTQTLEVTPVHDVSLDLASQATPEAIDDAKFCVFKFAAQFYYTILQRSSQKFGLPDLSRYLKAYMNEDVRCARWFVQEFINSETLEEIMMQNSQKIMRRVYIGIMTCAMLKLYEVEKEQLNLYWDDMDQNIESPRQTTLGNYILMLLYLLPKLKNFSNNQAQFLQLLAQFTRMGPQAKQFLVRADTIQRLLNFYFFENTPFRPQFIEAPRLPFDINEDPEMGSPTPEDSTRKKSTLAIKKEQKRLSTLNSSKPAFMYLIEVVSNLARCVTMQTPQGQPQSPWFVDIGYQFSLTSDNLVLWTPDVAFSIQLFATAHKSRAAVAFAKAYVHYGYYDEEFGKRIFQTIASGLQEYDFDKIRPFLILFQHCIEAAQEGSKLFRSFSSSFLNSFFNQVVRSQMRYFQWMEVVIDWVIKVAQRVPLMAEWMVGHLDSWTFLIEWLKENQFPPNMQQQVDRHSDEVVLNKMYTRDRQSNHRFAQRRNETLNFYRKNVLIQIKQGQIQDLSGETDIDYYHLDDNKLIKDQKVYILEDRQMYIFSKATIMTEMDELCYIRNHNTAKHTKWEATDKGIIFIEGVWENSHMARELTRIEQNFRQRAAQLAQQQREASQQHQQQHRRQINQATYDVDDEMDSDGNNTDEAQASIPQAYENEGVAHQQANSQDVNEEMLDQTDQDEYLAP